MPSLFRAATAAVLLLSTLAVAGPTLAASQRVECGQIAAFTAPDPLGPTDGSLQIGLLPAWTIAADATLDPPLDTALPSLMSGSPTCLRLDLDDSDVIETLTVAAHGSIAGSVVFDSGLDAYTFDDRLQLPTFVLDLYPGLQALFATSAAAGTTLVIAFDVDTSTGALTSLVGNAAFCGSAGLDGDGNGTIGAATIPAAVLDAQDLARLGGADGRAACAEVRAEGTLDPGTGALTLDTEVTIDLDATVAPTAPPTSVAAVSTDATPRADIGWLWIALATGVVVGVCRLGTRRPGPSTR